MNTQNNNFNLFCIWWISMLFSLCFFISCSKEDEELLSKSKACPQWVEGYPQVLTGTSTIDIKVELNRNGKVFYVISSEKAANITAEDIKNQATAQKAGTVIRNGIIEVASMNNEAVELITGLTSDKKYFLYLIGGADTLLMDNSQVVAIEKYLPKSQQAVNLGTTDASYGYFEYFPEEYYKKTSDKFPLVVFLHGSGEKGDGKTNLDLVLKNGPPKLIKEGKVFPFICISPQTSGSWTPSTLNTFIDFLKTKYRVNDKRIYLTGLSLGGIGTFAYALAYPDKLAAIVPVAGNGNTSQACKIKSLPLWAFHNEGDLTVLSSGSKNMVNAIKECGGSPLLTIYPVDGHDAWTAAYKDAKMWEWFLKQEKK